MKIGIKADGLGIGGSRLFEGDEYVIDFGREREGEIDTGAIRCTIAPWSTQAYLMTLTFDIRRDGSMQFISWEYADLDAPFYLQAAYLTRRDHKEGRLVATTAQKETVLGLVSGRLRFEGLKLPVGQTLMEVAGLSGEDFAAEEARCGRKIVLA